MENIRNFCIIAHIDHGKSTLADRMMELTGTVQKRDMKSQLLDSMDLEREKGITIKLTPVRMRHAGHDLNLIDTPGHVDFSYEVSRSLQACEGAILVVDASQGIQAQTLANVYLAIEQDLVIIPVLNKVDLPAADVPRVSKEVINLLGCDESDIIKISAKTGENVDQVLSAIIERVPAPRGKHDAPTRALIFDSYYDDYRGVILYVRVVDGQITKGDQIHMMATKARGLALEIGKLSPGMAPEPVMRTGEIGYIVTNLKTTRDAKVGDTVTLAKYTQKDTVSTKTLDGVERIEMARKILQNFTGIEYGSKDQSGRIHRATDQNFNRADFGQYVLQSPDEVEKNQVGVCWDQVEYARELFRREDIPTKTYAIVYYDRANNNFYNHTILTFEAQEKFYWFEHSMADAAGVHEFDSLQMLVAKLKEEFLSHNTQNIPPDYENKQLYLWEYDAPKSGSSPSEVFKTWEGCREVNHLLLSGVAANATTGRIQPLPGYKDVRPFVYAGFFPVSNEDYNELKEAIEKLSLSDSALQFEPENSPVLGFGVRIGFLGLLHMDIVRERLEREYNLDLVVTNPSTDYQLTLTSGEQIDIKSAADMPPVTNVVEIREPWINGEIVVPQEYIGGVIQLIVAKRGVQKNLSYIDERALISFEAPLANLLTDFYDQLKSMTSGYGSFNYELADYRAEDLVRIDFYVGGEMVDSLSIMAHRSESQGLGRDIVKKLKEVVPRQSFQVSLQAAIGGKFIAREDISAYRKDVTAKLYGGDVSRRKKLLAKQAKGKKRMKKFGNVEIPSEAFTVMLKRD